MSNNGLTFLISLNCRDFDKLNHALIKEFKKGNLKGNKPNKKEIIKRLNIFREMNPKISKYIYSNCAAKFQFRDSEIGRSIINKCMYKLIPVLCIHDSFIVQHWNKGLLYRSMNYIFKEHKLKSIPLIK